MSPFFFLDVPVDFKIGDGHLSNLRKRSCHPVKSKDEGSLISNANGLLSPKEKIENTVYFLIF